jgi:ankyrin repeat protein
LCGRLRVHGSKAHGAEMKTLPSSPDFSHLRKEAKALLRRVRAAESGDLHAATSGRGASQSFDPRNFRLHQAQLFVARDYGFQSWTELKRYVELRREGAVARRTAFAAWAYDRGGARERRLAARIWREEPGSFAGDLWIGCATGDEALLREKLARDPEAASRPVGPRAMTPIVAVTHSRLLLDDSFEDGLLGCARLLLDRGADVNRPWVDHRWPDSPLSALYGAAGVNHHVAMTKLLLEAGANPNDNESLYHSVESPNGACTRLLLDAGARVAGTNAINHVLDYDRIETLELLLAHGGETNERLSVHHAIERGRSLAHINVLAKAGADLARKNQDGVSVYRWAQTFGRMDVIEMLTGAGFAEPISEEERFVAACARGDERAGRLVMTQAPDIFSRLSRDQLTIMPKLAGVGAYDAVRAMLAIGWPREVKTAWDATALNLAVFRGDDEMARLLLDQGADWRTPHGFGDNVLGTLSYASRAEDLEESAPRRFVDCARALLDNGIARSNFAAYVFSDEVNAFLEDLWEG